MTDWVYQSQRGTNISGAVLKGRGLIGKER